MTMVDFARWNSNLALKTMAMDLNFLINKTIIGIVAEKYRDELVLISFSFDDKTTIQLRGFHDNIWEFDGIDCIVFDRDSSGGCSGE